MAVDDALIGDVRVGEAPTVVSETTSMQQEEEKGKEEGINLAVTTTSRMDPSSSTSNPTPPTVCDATAATTTITGSSADETESTSCSSASSGSASTSTNTGSADSATASSTITTTSTTSSSSSVDAAVSAPVSNISRSSSRLLKRTLTFCLPGALEDAALGTVEGEENKREDGGGKEVDGGVATECSRHTHGGELWDGAGSGGFEHSLPRRSASDAHMSRTADWKEERVQFRELRRSQSVADSDGGMANVLGEEQLTEELLKIIPKDEDGVFSSVGSIRHEEGFCKPCVHYQNPSKGCRNGILCLFCHHPGFHDKRIRARLSKKKRDIVHAVSKALGQMCLTTRTSFFCLPPLEQHDVIIGAAKQSHVRLENRPWLNRPYSADFGNLVQTIEHFRAKLRGRAGAGGQGRRFGIGDAVLGEEGDGGLATEAETEPEVSGRNTGGSGGEGSSSGGVDVGGASTIVKELIDSNGTIITTQQAEQGNNQNINKSVMLPPSVTVGDTSPLRRTSSTGGMEAASGDSLGSGMMDRSLHSNESVMLVLDKVKEINLLMPSPSVLATGLKVHACQATPYPPPPPTSYPALAPHFRGDVPNPPSPHFPSSSRLHPPPPNTRHSVVFPLHLPLYPPVPSFHSSRSMPLQRCMDDEFMSCHPPLLSRPPSTNPSSPPTPYCPPLPPSVVAQVVQMARQMGMGDDPNQLDSLVNAFCEHLQSALAAEAHNVISRGESPFSNPSVFSGHHGPFRSSPPNAPPPPPPYPPVGMPPPPPPPYAATGSSRRDSTSLLRPRQPYLPDPFTALPPHFSPHTGSGGPLLHSASWSSSWNDRAQGVGGGRASWMFGDFLESNEGSWFSEKDYDTNFNVTGLQPDTPHKGEGGGPLLHSTGSSAWIGRTQEVGGRLAGLFNQPPPPPPRPIDSPPGLCGLDGTMLCSQTWIDGVGADISVRPKYTSSDGNIFEPSNGSWSSEQMRRHCYDYDANAYGSTSGDLTPVLSAHVYMSAGWLPTKLRPKRST
eukprot:GHVS01083799.1.p1 GENE.GHVS01083799.1~~GHVS01083799.1.p1  ORF type:complete len:1007 (+),score=204.88 GHVS01083799.1:472-3492(+)